MVKKEHELKQIYRSHALLILLHIFCLLFADKRWQLPLWWLLLSPSFPKSTCPTQAIQRLWCFADSQSFCQSENLGSQQGKAHDDRFPLQSRQILTKICQVRSTHALFHFGRLKDLNSVAFGFVTNRVFCFVLALLISFWQHIRYIESVFISY